MPTPTPLRRLASALLFPLLALAAASGASCSAQPKGALMLAISTDMQTPKDISIVSIFVATNGTPKFDYVGRVLPDGSVALPATLALIQPDDPQAQVHIRVIGFQEQKARVLRDVLTTVPEQRTVLMRLALNFVDDGSGQGTLPAADVPHGVQSTTERVSIPTMVVPLASGTTADAAQDGLTTWSPLTITSRCNFQGGLTSINGICQSASVDSSGLPSFEPSAVFGDAGVLASGAPASCFDTAQCFAGAIPVTNVDPIACTFSASSASSVVTNLALVTPATGVCLQPGQCFVPLENDATEGWTQSGALVRMLPGICTQLNAGALLYQATGNCAPEVASLPLCEPTTVAELAEAGLAQSGGPDASAVDSSADASFDATVTDAANAGDGGAPADGAAVEAGPPRADDAADEDAGSPVLEAGACIPATCASLGHTCGPSADGCGGVVDCGTCSAPQICGGGGTPFVCGDCLPGALCSQIAACGGSPTSISGTVMSPSGADPVPNALVYIPAGALTPITDGPECNSCGTTAGPALSSTTTATDGTFTLTNVPTGNNIPLVVQLGRWRRQFTFEVTACVSNVVTGLALPANQSEGDIPLTAISTGSGDTTECILYKMGIDAAEFTTSTGSGRIRLYSSATDTGAGAVALSSDTVGETTLMTTDYSGFDQIVLPCWGSEITKTPTELANLASFANSGGKVLATHFSYVWLYNNSPLLAAANWAANTGTETSGTTLTATISTSTPTTTAFAQWMLSVGASTTYAQVSLTSPRHDVASVVSPTVDWMDATDPTDDMNQNLLMSFDTPIGSSSTCGRVTFADLHENGTAASTSSTVFPAECPSGALSPQEKVFEYMIYDLAGSTCVDAVTPTCTPLSCASQQIACGTAGDGCGNIISSCGTCTAGQTCGGGGFGQCG